MSRKDREELRRLRSWKADAMTVLACWNEVADKITDMPLGEFRSVVVGIRIDEMREEIAQLRAHVAELESTPPHPNWLAWAKVDKLPILAQIDGRWIHIGPEPPAGTPAENWAADAWDAFMKRGTPDET